MPGDRFLQLVSYQEGSVGLFANHRFVFDFADCSPLDALQFLFETAESTPRMFASKSKISTPRLEFSPDLVTALSLKKSSGFFGVNHNGYPHFSVAEMVALLCLDHGLELISADARVYRFGIAEPKPPMPLDTPVLIGAESGLSLFVSLPKFPGDQGLVRLVNRSTSTVRIGHADNMTQNRSANPFATWSVLPVDGGAERQHPSPFAADQMIPGCGTGSISYTGRILELAPGETIDLTNSIPLPWEFANEKVGGKFRAVLYLRNNPHLPLSTNIDLPESTKAEIMYAVRGTLDCLILSNEVAFDAPKPDASLLPNSSVVDGDQEPFPKVYYRPN